MKTANTIAETIGTIFGAIVSSAIPSLLGGLCLMIAWDAIAWECNLPQFGYWVYFSAFYVVRSLLTMIRAPKKDS